ncbi:MAG: RIO1 family regulatory kinase/ATPase domain-containing protein [Planctomycetota bacterium]|jgi:RIO kinase 1
MTSDSDHASALEPFVDEGWITEVLHPVKSGKEATVFCCRGGERAPGPLVAAKVYRPIESRRFRNDAMYVGGRLHMARNGRARRAVMNHSRFGRQVQYGTWLAQEWETLMVLHGAGADVPRPLAAGDRAILMPFLGDESGAAPMLHETAPDRATAARLVDDLLGNIELMLDHDCVHGDLSPYNVMLHEERAIIIDFPQAIDPRLNHHGQALLVRDVEHVCRWAARHGVRRPAAGIASRLWTRFVTGELG